MINKRLTFFDSTNIVLPITVYSTIFRDSCYFGYTKNHRANISGFLNRLIPYLSEYRNDLHEIFLKKNQNDEILTSKIEENIYKVYFNKYDYCDDATIKVPLRINSEFYEDFLIIHDVSLKKYNMDFTNYVRSLLIEYTSKRLSQREYFFFYRQVNIIKNAIQNNMECRFYTKDETLTFIPISIELSTEIFKTNQRNFLLGITADKETTVIVALSTLEKVFITESTYPITQEDSDFIYDSFYDYCKGEL